MKIGKKALPISITTGTVSVAGCTMVSEVAYGVKCATVRNPYHEDDIFVDYETAPKQQKETGEDTMYHDYSNAQDAQQRNYLFDRLDTLASQKTAALRVDFNLTEEAPKTLKEFLDRIKSGDITVKEDRMDSKLGYASRALDFIVWRSPKKVADEAGFEKAKAALTEAKTKATDVIAVLSLKEGLDAVNAFEGQSFS